jgi:hypothetical protein
VNPIKRFMAWLRPAPDPDAAAEAERLRIQRETVKTSQLTGPANLPPTPDVLDPKDPR